MIFSAGFFDRKGDWTSAPDTVKGLIKRSFEGFAVPRYKRPWSHGVALAALLAMLTAARAETPHPV